MDGQAETDYILFLSANMTKCDFFCYFIYRSDNELSQQLLYRLVPRFLEQSRLAAGNSKKRHHGGPATALQQRQHRLYYRLPVQLVGFWEPCRFAHSRSPGSQLSHLQQAVARLPAFFKMPDQRHAQRHQSGRGSDSRALMIRFW